MDARIFLFVGLAGVAGAALAMRSRAPAEGEGEGVTASGGGDAAAVGEWGAFPLFNDAAGYVSDALGAVVSDQQRLSYAALSQLKTEEGFSATPYPDHKGNSIAYGHLIKPGEDLTYVTEGEGESLLIGDVADAERAVRTAVTVPLSQNEFDALVLLAYNIGVGAFKKSTLVRKLNIGDRQGAAAEFPRWNMASGQVNETLVARRARERERFEA